MEASSAHQNDVQEAHGLALKYVPCQAVGASRRLKNASTPGARRGEKKLFRLAAGCTASRRLRPPPLTLRLSLVASRRDCICRP
uniref:Uncharacterized protein n=1 Tax=Setaria italica TaxID=4555 RepID=K3YB97_SETIT